MRACLFDAPDVGLRYYEHFRAGDFICHFVDRPAQAGREETHLPDSGLKLKLGAVASFCGAHGSAWWMFRNWELFFAGHGGLLCSALSGETCVSAFGEEKADLMTKYADRAGQVKAPLWLRQSKGATNVAGEPPKLFDKRAPRVHTKACQAVAT